MNISGVGYHTLEITHYNLRQTLLQFAILTLSENSYVGFITKRCTLYYTMSTLLQNAALIRGGRLLEGGRFIE